MTVLYLAHGNLSVSVWQTNSCRVKISMNINTKLNKETVVYFINYYIGDVKDDPEKDDKFSPYTFNILTEATMNRMKEDFFDYLNGDKNCTDLTYFTGDLLKM